MGEIKRTLNTSIVNYWEVNKNNRLAQSNLTTCLFKYTFPNLGFELNERSKSRLQQKDKELALEFAASIKVTSELPEKLLQALESTLNKSDISSSNRRHQRKILREFIEFLGIYKNTVKKEYKNTETEAKRINVLIVDRSHIENNKTKRDNAFAKNITLSFSEWDYPGSTKNIKKELERIKNEIEQFERFLLSDHQEFKKIRKPTAEMYLNHIKVLLGWLHKTKNISLNKLGFKSLVKIVDINVDIHNFDNMNDYYIAKGKAISKARSECKHTIDLLDDFFVDYAPSKRSKELYCITIVALCKFLYEDITDYLWADNYDDIPIIQRLRKYRRKLPEEGKKIQPQLMDWRIVIRVLEELRRRADTFHIEHIEQKTIVKYLRKRSRNRTTMARELQRFLILGMFTLVPPSRSRVVRELQIGKTFKHGLFLDGVFVPKDKLENPQSAKYYIHLQADDYKTGNKYGEWLATFPNVEFKDGSKFYDYLNRWIYEGYREVLMTEFDNKNSHDYLFVGARTGQKLNCQQVGNLVIAIFKYITGEKVSPQKLRTIFRTYLTNKGASQAELESAAFWMRHSNDIAKEVYTKQTLDEKLNPGIAIAQKLNSELLGVN